jgi:hypothetical protein
MHFYCVLNDFNIVDSSSFRSALKNQKFLTELNAAATLDKNLAMQIMQKWQPIALVLNTDQTPEALALINAATVLKIKTCVIAHGYFKNPWWVSVLPLNASRLYVWTEDVQIKLLKDEPDCEVHVLAGIKFGAIQVKDQKSNRVLVVGSPLYQYQTTPEYFRTFERAISALGQIKDGLNLEVVFKPHPLETSHELLEEILKKHGIKIVLDDVYELASNSLAVCGGLTSFLYEARQSGLVVVQLDEFSVFEPSEGYEGVPRCSATKLLVEIRRQIQLGGCARQANFPHQKGVNDLVSWLLSEAK